MLEITTLTEALLELFARQRYITFMNNLLPFESVAQHWVNDLYQALDHHGQPGLALVRLYRLGRTQELPAELLARCPDCKEWALFLMGSAGDEAAWNGRHGSRQHQIISLEAAQRRPMFAAAFEQLALDDSPAINLDLGIEIQRLALYSYFSVPQAQGSPAIPFQEDFVRPYGIQSVFGIGGNFLSGASYLLLLFSKVPFPPAICKALHGLAPYVATSLAKADSQGMIWLQ
jgi:hypothetical protein